MMAISDHVLFEALKTFTSRNSTHHLGCANLHHQSMDERPAGQTGGATFSGVVEVKISGLRKRGFSELSSLLYGASQFTVPFMGFAVIQSSLCCLQNLFV